MSLLSTAERATLLRLARDAVEARVTGRSLPGAANLTDRLEAPGAAFVTVHCRRELRGCLGCVEAREPSLAAMVIQMAAAAAGDDPRFLPLTAPELEDTRIDISVLGPLIPITGAHDLVIGRDGVVIERGACRGLLLPQVAVEWGWDPEMFLDETCRKAGLPRGAWRGDARIYRFEAQVFSEHHG